MFFPLPGCSVCLGMLLCLCLCQFVELNYICDKLVTGQYFNVLGVGLTPRRMLLITVNASAPDNLDVFDFPSEWFDPANNQVTIKDATSENYYRKWPYLANNAQLHNWKVITSWITEWDHKSDYLIVFTSNQYSPGFGYSLMDDNNNGAYTLKLSNVWRQNQLWISSSESNSKLYSFENITINGHVTTYHGSISASSIEAYYGATPMCYTDATMTAIIMYSIPSNCRNPFQLDATAGFVHKGRVFLFATYLRVIIFDEKVLSEFDEPASITSISFQQFFQCEYAFKSTIRTVSTSTNQSSVLALMLIVLFVLVPVVLVVACLCVMCRNEPNTNKVYSKLSPSAQALIKRLDQKQNPSKLVMQGSSILPKSRQTWQSLKTFETDKRSIMSSNISRNSSKQKISACRDSNEHMKDPWHSLKTYEWTNQSSNAPQISRTAMNKQSKHRKQKGTHLEPSHNVL